MLILRYSPASPYVRKVRIAAELLGLSDRLQLVQADTNDPGDALRQQTPLGKIPTLILENGQSLFDSRVIVDYLDHLAGGGRLVPTGPERFAVLTHQALCDGLLDAALLQVYEGRFRPADRHETKWLDHQAGKVDRALGYCETHLSEPEARLHVGHVAQASALGYLDLRFGGEWRRSYPRLVAWLDDFAGRVPAYAATAPT